MIAAVLVSNKKTILLCTMAKSKSECEKMARENLGDGAFESLIRSGFKIVECSINVLDFDMKRPMVL